MYARFVRVLSLGIGFVLMLTALMTPNTVGASAQFFPVNQQEAESQFQVSHDPADSCYQFVVEPGGGIEFHGAFISAQSVGSQAVALTLDLNRGKYTISGATPFGQTPGSNGNGDRYVVQAGQAANVFTTGSCGVGFSIWPGMPQQSCQAGTNPCNANVPSQSNAPVPQTQSAPQSSGNVQPPASCPASPQEASLISAGKYADAWSVIDGSGGTGWKFQSDTPRTLTSPFFGELQSSTAQGTLKTYDGFQVTTTAASFWCNATPASRTNPAQASQPQTTSTSTSACTPTLGAAEAAQHSGGSAANFSPAPNAPNGQVYNGPAIDVHSDLPIFEVLTPGFPAQPGLPQGKTENTVVFTVFKICP